MKKETYNNIETLYNGEIYLARDRFYSCQYLGSGKTAKEAVMNMETTIRIFHLKPRAVTYF
jgi:hypothetical protein